MHNALSHHICTYVPSPMSYVLLLTHVCLNILINYQQLDRFFVCALLLQASSSSKTCKSFVVTCRMSYPDHKLQGANLCLARCLGFGNDFDRSEEKLSDFFLLYLMRVIYHKGFHSSMRLLDMGSGKSELFYSFVQFSFIFVRKGVLKW